MDTKKLAQSTDLLSIGLYSGLLITNSALLSTMEQHYRLLYLDIIRLKAKN